MSSPAAAPSTTVMGRQGAAIPAGVATSGRTSIGSPSEVLAEAAIRIEAETPWYETLGLRCEEAAGGGGDLAVETVLAFNIVSGLIDAANETVLAPVFVVLKGLLSATQGAAAAREEIVELIRYCVGISKCLLEAAKAKDMPTSTVATLGEFKGEMEAVGRFAQTYGTRSRGCCRGMVFNSNDRDTAAGHKQKLKDLLDAVLAGLAVQAHVGIVDVRNMIAARDPPRPGALAEIPREAPRLPMAYVQRTTMLEGVVADFTNPQRSASATHCLLGMGGGGKTLMASSVVRDDRVRASFKDGIFWVPVGREGKDVALLLEHLAIELARAPSDVPRRCPDRFTGAEEALRHLSAVRAGDDLTCLVVLDNVWGVEVVNAFASTGFHVLVTTRQKAVISPAFSGLCTEVGDMLEEDALEVLRKASRANGPIPAEEARKVAHDCSMLPLALSMVGSLAKDQPLDSRSWRTVHEKLQRKHAKFREMENGKLFSTIDTSLCDLPSTQQEQLQLMAVMASGVMATPEMLASLWDQDISGVPIGAGVLVDRCLLQGMLEGYRLHDLVLEYLQLAIGTDDGRLARKASSRQARYLARLGVFLGYAAGGSDVSTGGLYSIIALWNSVKKLDGNVNVEARYTESLEGVVDIGITRAVASLLMFLGNYSGAEAMLMKAFKEAVEQGEFVHFEIGFALDSLAAALQQQGKYEKAGSLAVAAIDIKERCLGSNHPSVAISLANRAAALHSQRKYDEADPLYLRAIEMEERSLDADHPTVAVTLCNRAGLLHENGKPKEADLLFVRAIEIQEQALGLHHPRLAGTLFSRAIILQAQGELEDADCLLVRAVEIQEEALGPDHPDLAASLHQRAVLLQAQGKLEEAAPFLVRAIDIKERAFGPDHPRLATTLASHASLLEAQELYAEADHVYRRYIEIREKALGPDHPEVAVSLHNRARLLPAQGKFDEAKPLLERALVILRGSLGEGNPHTTMVLDTLKELDEREGKNNEGLDIACNLANLADIFENQGKLEEAGLLYVRAIEIREKVLGPDHPSLAAFLGNHAILLSSQGSYDEADRVYLRCIEIQEKALGPDHQEVAQTLTNRAIHLKKQGKLDEADILLVRAIGIQEKAVGPDHPSLADSLGSRADLLRAQERYDEADPLFVRAIKIQETAIGPDHSELATSLHNRAILLKAQGKLDEADPLLVRAIQIWEKTPGPDYPSITKSLKTRADLLQAQGKYDEADPLFVRAIAIQEKTLGPDDLNLASSLGSRAELLISQGKYDEADLLFVGSMEIQKRALGPDHPSLANNLCRRAYFLIAQEKYDEADHLYLRAVEIQEKALGPDHPDLALSLNNRAEILKGQGKHEDSDLLYVRSIEITENAFGPDHPSLAVTLTSRACLLQQQGKIEEAKLHAARAIQIEGNSPGPAGPNLGYSLDTLAELLKTQGKYQEADPLYLRALDVFEQTLGSDHPYYADVLHNRAGLLQTQGNQDEARLLFEKALAIRKEGLGEGHRDTVLTSNALLELGECQRV